MQNGRPSVREKETLGGEIQGDETQGGDSQGWETLRSQFLRVARDDPQPWHVVWRCLISHPSYQTHLKVCAHRICRRRRLSEHASDVAQEAVVLLAGKLRKTPDLHYNPQAPRANFAAWLRQITRRDCEQAARRLQQMAPPAFELLPTDKTTDPAEQLDNRLDIHQAVSELPEPVRRIVRLYALGRLPAAIATKLKMRRDQVDPLLREGLERLRTQLSSNRRRA